jgi:HAD superfamily hydrolase (TIGR01549 family)
LNSKRVKGIVFDLDATLVNLGGFVDWRKAHENIIQSYLEYDCDPKIVQTCSAKGLFNMIEEMHQHLLYKNGVEKANQIQHSVYQLLSDYEKIGADSCTLMEGCTDILEWLREKKIPLGICTSNSKRTAEVALNVQGINDYFQVVIGRTVGIPMKPHPAQLQKCFVELNVNPINSIMVGDSHKDVIAGKKLGAFTVGIPVYFTRIELMKNAGVDVILDNLSELKYVIESFKSQSLQHEKPNNIIAKERVLR